MQVPAQGETAMSAWLANDATEEEAAAKRQAAERYLQWLPRKQRFVVCLTMGFGGKEMSSEEIALKLRLSPQEVQKIYDEAIAALTIQAHEFAEFVKSLQVPSISVH